MEIPLLKDVAVIFGLAIVVLWLCNFLRIPAIVGFLLTGILSGPHGLKLVNAVSDVEMLSEIGIMLLLFTIGLEFSLTRLLSIKRYFFIGGIFQTALTVLSGILIGQVAGRPFGESIFLGFLLSMSSTAIVLKFLSSRDETDSPHGKVSIGILIFQDIIAVPMMLLTPVLAQSTEEFNTSLLLQLLLGIILISFVFVAAIKVVPMILYQIARVRSRELFSLSVLTICFFVAWLSSSIGLSLAIGAFLAGLIISESDYRHEAVGNIIPLQDIFSCLFFVSIGMLLDLRFFFDNPFLILGITLCVLALKFVIVALTAGILGLPLRVMILSGIALCQIGEFSFVLVKAGIDQGLANAYLYQLFLAVAIITMALTPSLMTYGNQILSLISKLPFPKRWKTGLRLSDEKSRKHYDQHIIIIGFGIAGRSLARAAKEADLSYVILEINPDTVKNEKANGEPIHFGDATHETVMHHLHVANAKVIAIMINDSQAARRAVVLARKLNESAYIIVRARYLQEVPIFKHLGADDVIPDEFGTSIEMFTRVLNRYNISKDSIDKMIFELRELDTEAKIATSPSS